MKEKITSKSCVTCGACCWSPQDQEGFCDVTPDDIKRLPKHFVRLHVLQPRSVDMLASIIDGNMIPYGVIETRWRVQKSGPFRGVNACVCSALRGSVFHKVSCSVYETRPGICRKFKPGSEGCRESRRMFRQSVEESRDR